MISGIGFAGAMGVGKDTCSEILKNLLLYETSVELKQPIFVEQLAFADSLKGICVDYLGLSWDDCYTQEGKQKFNPTWGMTNREILQKVGTDAMRNGFHPDVWCKITDLKIKEILSKNYFYIISDIRFSNEAEIVKQNNGAVIEVVRNKTVVSGITDHVSEQKIDPSLVDIVVSNNGTKDELRDQLHDILKVLMADK